MYNMILRTVGHTLFMDTHLAVAMLAPDIIATATVKGRN
jgi:hypothetical protein